MRQLGKARKANGGGSGAASRSTSPQLPPKQATRVRTVDAGVQTVSAQKALFFAEQLLAGATKSISSPSTGPKPWQRVPPTSSAPTPPGGVRAWGKPDELPPTAKKAPHHLT